MMTPSDLRAARLRLGLTQPEFAALLGLAARSGQQQVTRWERGERPIPERIALRLKIMELERKKE